MVLVDTIFDTGVMEELYDAHNRKLYCVHNKKLVITSTDIRLRYQKAVAHKGAHLFIH